MNGRPCAWILLYANNTPRKTYALRNVSSLKRMSTQTRNSMVLLKEMFSKDGVFDVISLIPKLYDEVKFVVLASTMISTLFRTSCIIINLVHFGFRLINWTFFHSYLARKAISCCNLWNYVLVLLGTTLLHMDKFGGLWLSVH